MEKEPKKDKSFGVVAVKQDGDDIKFLLVKQREGHWGFPKGIYGRNSRSCLIELQAGKTYHNI